MPTATRLLSPRNGTLLSFFAPGFRTSCAQPCFPASKPKGQHNHRENQAKVGFRRDQDAQQEADDDGLRKLLQVAQRDSPGAAPAPTTAAKTPGTRSADRSGDRNGSGPARTSSAPAGTRLRRTTRGATRTRRSRPRTPAESTRSTDTDKRRTARSEREPTAGDKPDDDDQ